MRYNSYIVEDETGWPGRPPHNNWEVGKMLKTRMTEKAIRDFVVSHLSWSGDHYSSLTNGEITQVLWLADGFGDLYARIKKVKAWHAATPEQMKERGIVFDCLFDWSHVRDSSPEAMKKMAQEILGILKKKGMCPITHKKCDHAQDCELGLSCVMCPLK